MKTQSLIRRFLIGLGVARFALNGVRFKRRDEVLRLGDLGDSVATEKAVPALGYAGGGCILAGVLLMLLGGRKRR